MFCQMTETRVKTLNHTSNRHPRRMTACPPTNQQRKPPHQNPTHRRPSPAPTRRVTINPAKTKGHPSQRVRCLAWSPNQVA